MALRSQVAALAPNFIRTFFRRAEQYGRRLRLWHCVIKNLVPADDESTSVLRKSLIRAPLTMLNHLDSFELPILLEDVVVDVRGIGRFNLRVGSDDILHVLRDRELEIWDEVNSRLIPGTTFIDAGANIGFYSVLGSKLVGDSGRVVAFEMMPDTAAIFRQHMRLNSVENVLLIEGALSNTVGVLLSASLEPGKYGQASITAEICDRRIFSFDVLTTTLDAALADVDSIDLLKLDLEGAEFLALSGGRLALSRTKCLIFESNDEDQRIFNLLLEEGFQVKRLAAHDFIAERL